MAGKGPQEASQVTSSAIPIRLAFLQFLH